jgi:uncharacterized protein
MPWTAASAKGFTKKADTPRKQAAWAKAANAALKKYKNEGKAIKVANAAVANMGSEEADMEDQRRRRTTIRSPGGRIIETREEEEENDSVSEEEENDSVSSDDITRIEKSIMHDSLTLEFDDMAEAQIIDGGYMRAMPKIARTGIQIYKGIECGRADVEKVRVYRPQDQVFAKAAVDSYTHLPITLEHPGTTVDATNWKKFAVGETGDEVLRDGGTVRVPMMLRDATAIKAVKSGKNQISVGYACDLEWVDGITPEGDKYDAVQRNIRGNHVAIVSTARGGPELKFGDKGERAMDKTVTIDGIACKMDEVAATLVQRLQDQFENFKKKKKKEEEEEEQDGLNSEIAKKDAALAARDAAIIVKDKEIADLQAKLKDALAPERLDQAVKDRAAVIDKATKIAGKQFKTDGVNGGRRSRTRSTATALPSRCAMAQAKESPPEPPAGSTNA